MKNVKIFITAEIIGNIRYYNSLNKNEKKIQFIFSENELVEYILTKNSFIYSIKTKIFRKGIKDFINDLINNDYKVIMLPQENRKEIRKSICSQNILHPIPYADEFIFVKTKEKITFEIHSYSLQIIETREIAEYENN